MTSSQMERFTDKNFADLQKNAPEDAYSFLKDYTVDDIYCVSIPGNSTSIWQVSPPSLANIQAQLQNPSTKVSIDFTYSVSR